MNKLPVKYIDAPVPRIIYHLGTGEGKERKHVRYLNPDNLKKIYKKIVEIE